MQLRDNSVPWFHFTWWNKTYFSLFLQSLSPVRFPQNSLVIILLSSNYTLLVLLSCMHTGQCKELRFHHASTKHQSLICSSIIQQAELGAIQKGKILIGQLNLNSFFQSFSLRGKNRHELYFFLFNVPSSELLIQEFKLQLHIDPVDNITLMPLTPHQTQNFGTTLCRRSGF